MNTAKDQPEPLYLAAEQMQLPEYARPHNLKRLAFLVGALLLLLLAGTWMLSILGRIPSLWAAIFSAFFTILGVLPILLQLLSSSTREPPVQPPSAPVVTPSLWTNYGLLHGVKLGISDQMGSLIVYVPRYLRGSTVYVCSGSSKVDLRVDHASSIVACRINDPLWWLGIRRVAFVAVFPSLEPGIYTAYTEAREHVNCVNIYAGLITEIDWR